MVLGPLVAVFVLVGIDYGVWNWAIGGNHQIVALVAGLAMAPLVIALAWLAALALGSGALAVGRRLAREIATRLLGTDPSRSIRLASHPLGRRKTPRNRDREAPHDRIAA